MVTVVDVDSGSELLGKVQELWRGNSDTLGFLPEGAFEEHARRRCLLAAIEEGGHLIGYVLFRTTHHRRAAIVHLCVAPKARGKGIAKHLFEAVKVRVSACDDIMVRCRRDFYANNVWPHLGFTAVGDAPGRARDGTELTIWRYELNPLPLLAAIADRGTADALSVVIDANIFFDLDEQAVGHDESKALLADWLGEFIRLCLTNEIYNEINRQNNPLQRERQRARANRFKTLQSDKALEVKTIAELRKLFRGDTDSGLSDIRQLAKSIAAGATCFVTRDGEIRSLADDLYDRFSLTIVSPFELILQFDELRRESEYRPRRFIEPTTRVAKPRPADLARIADLIHLGQPAPEPRKRTLSRLRDILAEPNRFEFTCISRADGELLAAYAIERSIPGILRLPIFAVDVSPLGKTAARHFAEKIITLAMKEQRRIVEVAAEAGGQRIEEALLDAGFSKEGNSWIKIALPMIASARDIAVEVDQIASQHVEALNLGGRVVGYLENTSQASATQSETLIQVERALWPAKILGTGLPCFVVSIKPRWAKDLFDIELADRTLFGADPLLVMNSENAYYRAAKPGILSAPARVLWYVSKDLAHRGTMAVRACSYLDEVLVAQPKVAFRRFRRLGVYTWSDVFKIAENDLNKDVMAFRFSKTELFQQPVGWDRLQTVLRRHGKGSQIQSPLDVTESCFLELYQLGMGGA